MSENVKLRQMVERRIVRKVILAGRKAGFTFNVANGGDHPELPDPTNDVRNILGAMFATDDEHLLFYKDGKRVGWVYFIYGNGNGGLDVISDCTTNLEPVLAPVCDWVNQQN